MEAAVIRITPELLRTATGCTQDAADLYADPLSQACAYYGINTPQRLAAFLAQIGHESSSLKHTTEVWGPTEAQSRYETRRDLGNIYPGDGFKFRGHGLIQVTGRKGIAATRERLIADFGAAEVPDFEQDPTPLTQPCWACLSAAEWWAHHGANELADSGSYIEIGRLINRGNARSLIAANGEADRLRRWSIAKAALAGIESQPSPAPAAPDAGATPATDQSSPAPPQPQPAPTQAPQRKESPMGATFLWGLAQSLISVFAPLAREKITKEVGRHTSDPAVAEQMAGAIISKAQELTGHADPIDAVAAAKASPAMVQQIEADALDTLERLAPLLEKLAQWDRDAWRDNQASMDSAAKRASAEPWDMAQTLVVGMFALLGALILFVCVIAGVQAYKGDIKPEVWAQVAGLIGFATGVATTIYAYRFGTSRSSSAKDVVIGELSRRPSPTRPSA